ncbi:phycobilisome linker polypeptide [Pseudanabaena minima]|uniref:phycobilisome linker polypeptide n=1 Tax=Pseudanabaena minima TaxID=890415 RepID=UPI003DA9BD00
MKSIDINSANPNLSVDPSHRITIEFTGGNQANKMQSARCTVTVPYSSLSKRLQSIQRFGGKITNISIQGLQPNLTTVEPVIALVEDNKATVEATPAIAIEQAVTTPLETHSELTVESTAQSVTEDTSEIVSESVPEIKLEHVSEPILENIPSVILDDAPEISSENTSEAAVSTSKPEKVLSETTAKPKKTRASTKTGHGFSKKEPSTPRKEPVAIAEVVTEPEPVMEIISESISTNQEPVAEPTVKAQKSRTSTKTKTSNSISKKDSSPQGQEPAITEIVAAPEPVVEIVPEITVEPISETVVETAAKFSPEQDTNHLPETSSEQISDIILNGLKETVKNNVEASLPVTTVEPVIESSEVVTPLSKSKKTKTSSKSGNGFNKPKSDLQVPRSPRKPKN